MQQIVDELVEVTKTLADYKDKYDSFVLPLERRISELRAKVASELSKSGQFSARFNSATVTRSIRKRLKVTDERASIEELKATGLSAFVSEQLNDLWQASENELLKEGRVPLGTVVEERESLARPRPCGEEFH